MQVLVGVDGKPKSAATIGTLPPEVALHGRELDGHRVQVFHLPRRTVRNAAAAADDPFRTLAVITDGTRTVPATVPKRNRTPLTASRFVCLF
jgi:hypothetical protein